jgi:phenylacetate-CoA ligase
MPFIRYDTSDSAVLSNEECSCGRKYSLLKEITGRRQDFVVTPEGGKLYGAFFSHIFSQVREILEYQIIQTRKDAISILIVPSSAFDATQIEKIHRVVQNKSSHWEVNVNIVDEIPRSVSGKHRFIISNLSEAE